MKIVIELPEGFSGETVQIRPVPELGSGEVLYIKVTRATELPVQSTEIQRVPNPGAQGGQSSGR